MVIALTGCSGVVYGVRMLEVCRELGLETDLIISRPAELILKREVNQTPSDLQKLATRSYSPDDLQAPLASGSTPFDGMVIIPCSMKTLAALASGYSSNLITRAADVALKQGRPLVLVPRETPLNLIHLENMLKLKRAGATVLPAMPAFYHEPKSIQELVDFVVGRVLETLGLKHELYRRWSSG